MRIYINKMPETVNYLEALKLRQLKIKTMKMCLTKK